MDVLTLLRTKNRCVARFLEISQEFLDASATSDILASLETLQHRREAVLKAMALFDRRIEASVKALLPAQRTSDLKAAVQSYLKEKDELVEQIKIADESLLSLIENEKAQLQEDILSSKRGKQSIGKFKSGWVGQAGEELDKTL